jgi:hypothetical protein
MIQRFTGKVALITGASAGIGAACAHAFAREGASVVLVARTAGPLDELAAELRAAGAAALPAALDVTDLGAARALIDRVRAELSGIDILVNNAGYNRRGPIEKFSAEELARVVEVNLSAPIAWTRLCLPELHRRRGAVVNVASLAGRIPLNHEAVYSASKFGLRAFSLALAEELQEAGVRVSCVSPGPVDTGFIMGEIDSVPDLVFAQPMSRSEQIAALVLDCAADGKPERMAPRLSGYLATLGYLFPSLRRLLVPIMEKKGRRVKAAYRQRLEKAT